MIKKRRRLYSFWIDEHLLVGLKAVRDRDGVLPSEQIRRALSDWLLKTGSPRPSPSRGKRPSKTRGKG